MASIIPGYWYDIFISYRQKDNKHDGWVTEFVDKEQGIIKPLSPEDDEKKNLNKTKYRLQINKITLAIKEIIQGLKGAVAEPLIEKILANQR